MVERGVERERERERESERERGRESDSERIRTREANIKIKGIKVVTALKGPLGKWLQCNKKLGGGSN